MDWLLGCFKCRQRRQTGCSINRQESTKDGSKHSVAAAFLGANSADKASMLLDGNSNLQTGSFKMSNVLTVPGSGLARTSSGLERRHRSARAHSSDQLLLVEKLEEEINNLNKKLVEEASQARNLTNEVRHLRHCSELLDSPYAFKRALDALENDSEKGDLDESRPLLYLQSMLSRIETTEMIMEPSSGEKTDARTLKEDSINLSSSFEKEQNITEKGHDNVLRSPDQGQQRHFGAVPVEEGLQLNEEHNASISVCQPLFEAVNIDANKRQLMSVLKRRRSSTTYSFSGFLVFEEETELGTISEEGVSEHCSNTEISATKIIETPDTGSENLVETSKSLFAFATSSSPSHSISTEQSLPRVSTENFSFLNSDSEVGVCFKMADAGGSLLKLNKSLGGPQDDDTQRSFGLCADFITEQSQVDTPENSYDGFSDVSSHISTALSSKVGSRSSNDEEVNSSYDSEVLHLKMLSLEDKESGKRCANSCAIVSKLEDINSAIARNLCRADFCSSAEFQHESLPRSKGHVAEFCLQHGSSVDSLNNAVAAVSDFEAECGFKPLYYEGQLRIRNLEGLNDGEAQQPKRSSSHVAASDQAELSEKDKYTSKAASSIISLRTVSNLSQGQCSTLVSDSIAELSPCEGASVSSPSTGTSQHSVDTLSPPTQVAQDGHRCSSEIPSTPISVNLRASMLTLSQDDSSKPHYTPMRTPLASFSQVETPNSLHSQVSPTSLGEDRPILGTVAAHWNHSSSTKKKWWDGKGIPNSTNKYREDQQVSWHATPFEVRLERALAKQGRVFQKKLFTGAMATEMEVSI